MKGRLIGGFNQRPTMVDLLTAMFAPYPLARKLMLALLTGILASSLGCSNSSKGSAPGMVILVPGVAGDGSWYRNVVPALRSAGDQRTVESFRWGAPSFAFFLNFNSVSIHEAAERQLADRIVAYREQHPMEKLDIVAHSAGGGVILGALSKLPPGVRVNDVILLHPSVSPRISAVEAARSVRLDCTVSQQARQDLSRMAHEQLRHVRQRENLCRGKLGLRSFSTLRRRAIAGQNVPVFGHRRVARKQR
jgi:pimeloyl-ACP methyl ester carboxylesterase